MALAQVLDDLRFSREHRENFIHWEEIPPRPARYADYPTDVHPELIAALARRGIARPWTHQAEAAAAALAGRHCVVVTPTASGKTLCYTLPVLSTILREPAARALYLFPTKALAQDQYDELHGLIAATGKEIRTFTYDGDTPQDARQRMRASGHIVITNPDMLHTGILPHHTKWQRLFANLRYVVIDELHQYRGVFGSHVANVIRRLRRICQFYGADPVFICCSATIANPVELAEGLTGQPVQLIASSGAPAGKKVVAIYNPPVVNRELGLRRSSMAVVRSLAGSLIRGGAQSIVFASSRTGVEVLLTNLRREMQRRPGPPLSERVHGYRGGYLPNERRQIEQGLRDGTVRGVVSTNALELGIDIGGLEAAVLLGYPGSISSTWQQFGRAGRRHDLAFAVMVCTSSALSQYIAENPEFIFGGRPEQARINPDNFYILVSHLKCAAFELPFGSDEPEFGKDTNLLLGYLCDEGILHLEGGKFWWMHESYPAENISLRAASVDNFVIIDTGEDGSGRGKRLDALPDERTRHVVIGEVDRPSAPMLVHKDAIYFHGGQQYHVDRLDRGERKAYVHKVDVDYYTDAELAVDLAVLMEDRNDDGTQGRWYHGDVKVSFYPTVFKKIKLDTSENVGWEKIDLHQEDLHTVACWLALPDTVTAGMPPEEVEGGLWAVGTVLHAVAPVFVLCDPRDLHVTTQVRSPHTRLPTVFLYDAAPGGTGLTELLFDLRAEMLASAAAHLRACGCAAGCPSCCGPQNELGGNPKQAALRLLTRLIGEAAPAGGMQPAG